MTSRGHGEPKDRTTVWPLRPCTTSKVGFQSQEAKSWCGCIFAHSYLISWQHKQSESQYSRWRPLANLFSVAVTHNFSCGVSRHLQCFLFEKYSKLYFVWHWHPTATNMDNVQRTSTSPPPSFASSCIRFAHSTERCKIGIYFLTIAASNALNKFLCGSIAAGNKDCDVCFNQEDGFNISCFLCFW